MYFAVATGVPQGFVVVPSLFNVCINWVIGKKVVHIFKGVLLGGKLGFVLFLKAFIKEPMHLL